jgi:hypothetical protein
MDSGGCSIDDDIWSVVCEEHRPSQPGREAAPTRPELWAPLAEVTSSTPGDKVKRLVRAALNSSTVIIIDELSVGAHPQFIVGQVSDQVVSIVTSAILVNVGGAPVDEMTRIVAAPATLHPQAPPDGLRVPFIVSEVGGASRGPYRRHMGMFKLRQPEVEGEKMMMASLFIQAW